MRRLLQALSCPWLAAVLAGQQLGLTAHPQETQQNGNFSYAPFGCFATGSGAEARSQILVRAEELPGPGAVLLGIELHCLATAVMTYSSLQIDASPTTATSLYLTFAANVTGPVTTVLQATSLQVPWSQTSWVPIAFTQPYVHDGTSALLLDVQKVVSPASIQFQTMDSSSSPPRTDRPLMVYASGGPGSGAATAATAAAAADPVSFRLRWFGVPTLRNRSDLAPGGHQYGLGGSVSLTVQGTPASLYVVLAATAFTTPPITLPPIVGPLRVNGPTLGLGFLSGAGDAVLLINIPNNVNLVGMYLVYQAGTLDAVGGLPMLTNGTDHFVNS